MRWSNKIFRGTNLSKILIRPQWDWGSPPNHDKTIRLGLFHKTYVTTWQLNSCGVTVVKDSQIMFFKSASSLENRTVSNAHYMYSACVHGIIPIQTLRRTHTFLFQWTTSGLPRECFLFSTVTSLGPCEFLRINPVLKLSAWPCELLRFSLTSALLFSLLSAFPWELLRPSLLSDFLRELLLLNLPSDLPLELFLLSLPSDLLLELLLLSRPSDFPRELSLLNLPPSDLPLELLRLSIPPEVGDDVCEPLDDTRLFVFAEWECLLDRCLRTPVPLVVTWPRASWLPRNPTARIISGSPFLPRVLLRSIQLREKSRLLNPNLRGILDSNSSKLLNLIKKMKVLL